MREDFASMVLQKVLGSKVVDNCLSDLPYGDNPNGIHRSTTADILHSLEGAVFQEFFMLWLEVYLIPLKRK